MRQIVYKAQSMRGLGDNIYQRAFIKNLPPESFFVLDTPWPEIYEDLPHVYFAHCETELRTQKKNVKKTDYCGRRDQDLKSKLRPNVRTVNLNRLCYTNTGILKGMQERFKQSPSEMDLPTFAPSERIASLLKTKYALVRPITIRTEWKSDARNPLPEYLQSAIEVLKKAGYKTVSIADVDGVNETFVGTPPRCDYEFNKGELGIRELLCLTQNAALVVGGIGWAVPAAIAYKVKAIFICGGWGEYNHPDKLLPNYPTPSIKFLMPDNFCLCRSAEHRCDKTITNFDDKFLRVLHELTA